MGFDINTMKTRADLMAHLANGFEQKGGNEQLVTLLRIEEGNFRVAIADYEVANEAMRAANEVAENTIMQAEQSPDYPEVSQGIVAA